MLARGNIRLRSPSLDLRRFTLDDVDDACRLIAEGQAHGKLSIDIEGEGS